MEMSHSVEGRVPFLDHNLVEAVVKMPVTQKINGMTEKYLLREAAKPVLTNTVYRRQKHPFLAPPVLTQLNGPLFSLMQDTLRSQSFVHVPFYDRKKIVDLMDRLPSMDESSRAAMDPILTMALSFCVLQSRLQVS